MPFDVSDQTRLGETVSAVRDGTLRLAAPLSREDMIAQAMDDASPTKWHLAHTTWFFDEFVLAPLGFPRAPDSWRFLFNSYYEGVGVRHPRPRRGLITRPPLDEILAWRGRVDDALLQLCADMDAATFAKVVPLIELGLHHEEQHQELILTDILALFAAHPETPAYRTDEAPVDESSDGARPLGWLAHEGGLVEIGAADASFAFDCERPRHRVWLEPFALADRLVTNSEWLAFMEDGGYEQPLLWLSDAWTCARCENWRAPAYWTYDDGQGWMQGSLRGRAAVDPAAPVCHVSYWEADAFARWAGARLPGEAEWEALAASEPADGNLLHTERLRPARVSNGAQFFGDVWEWTRSAYSPYPGFRPLSGAVGEYNGKFMAGQFVLRGGSCVTPRRHIRATYRNFFYPHQRWQFMGLRLAKDGT
jgi:ergothioneine biosynthesis protein EgtB